MLMRKALLEKFHPKVTMKKSLGVLSVAICIFLLQHRYNPRFRRQSAALGHLLLFIASTLGIGGSIGMLMLKMKAKKMEKKGK